VALLTSLGLWWKGGPWWVGLVLLLMFTHTSSMMSLTEAAMAHLVAGDWGRYGRVRLWGSAGFMVTVFAAGAWFERFGMGHFPGWTAVTLAALLACTLWVPDAREKPSPGTARRAEPVGPVLRRAGGALVPGLAVLPRDGALRHLRLPVAVPGCPRLRQGDDRRAVGGVGAGGDRLVLPAGAADARRWRCHAGCCCAAWPWWRAWR
jgi:hypothetical protein